MFPFAINTMTSNHCLCRNTAQPGESRATANEESVGEVQVFELVQKITWLQKLKQKFRRRQRA